MSRLAFIIFVSVIATNATLAFDGAGSGDNNDTTRVVMKQYIGVAPLLMSNQRLIGLPEQYGAQFGNAPVVGVGLNILWWGDLLFNTNQLRWGGTFAKFVNTHPSPKLLENLRSEFQLGYAAFETPAIKAYPYFGFGSSVLSLDSLARIFLLTVEAGAGVDYFLPGTPLVFTVQAAYNHSFNIRAATDASGNQPGFAARLGVSVFIREKRTYWGWD